MGSWLEIYTGFLFTFHRAWRSGLQAGYLQLLTYPETRDRWASAKAFTVRLLIALQNRRNNRNRVNRQFLSLVNSQGNCHGKDKEGQNSICVKDKWSPLPFFWDKGDTTQAQKGSLGVKKSGDNASPYWVLLLPEAFTPRFILAEEYMHSEGKVTGQVRCGKRNQLIG